MPVCTERPQLFSGHQRMAQQKSNFNSTAMFLLQPCMLRSVRLIQIWISPLQDSSGLKLWKRRWFVLSNFCLFYYKGMNASRISALHFFSEKSSHVLRLYSNESLLLFAYCLSSTDSREESVLGSIPLPSYKILFCTPRECKNRKFTFKVSSFFFPYSSKSYNLYLNKLVFYILHSNQ